MKAKYVSGILVFVLIAALGVYGYFVPDNFIQKAIVSSGWEQAESIFVKDKYTIEYLKTRFEEVKSLNIKLKATVEKMEAARQKLLDKINANYEYIIDKQNGGTDLSSYEKAIADNGINTALKMINTNQHYVAQLEKVALEMRKGSSELQYLQDKFESDVVVAEAIGDNQIEALVNEINVVIQKYQPLADELVINYEGEGSVDVDSDLFKSVQDKIEQIKQEKEWQRQEKERQKQIAIKKELNSPKRGKEFVSNLRNFQVDLDYYFNVEKNAYKLSGGNLKFHKDGWFGAKYDYQIMIPEKMIFIGHEVVLGLIIVADETNFSSKYYNHDFYLVDSYGAYFPSSIIVAQNSIGGDDRGVVVELHKGRKDRLFLVFSDAELKPSIFQDIAKWQYKKFGGEFKLELSASPKISDNS